MIQNRHFPETADRKDETQLYRKDKTAENGIRCGGIRTPGSEEEACKAEIK